MNHLVITNHPIELAYGEERQNDHPNRPSIAREELRPDRTLAAVRGELLDAIDAIAETLARGASQSDLQGKLVEESVSALTSTGLWRTRLCRELGGFELPVVIQIELIAALAAEDTSSAWCTMVANNGLAVLGATMPIAAVQRVFARGVPNCSIVAAPGGSATPTQGGYLLNGTWRLASSIHHATWIHATAYVERDPSRLLPFAIAARDVELLDSWKVVGLSGTGSNDFKLTDYFLPAELAGSEDRPYGQLRGERRYDLVDVEHIESYEHLAFAIGVTRRALRELQKGFSKPLPGRYTADREVVLAELGRAVVELQAVEALAHSLFARIDAAALGGVQAWSTNERQLPRALAAWATALALRCVQLGFHRSGLAALRNPNIFEKLLRDMNVAATHVVVDDAAFSAYALHLVETGAAFKFHGSALVASA